MITTIELAQAKEAVNTLLEQLGLATYLFDIEPRQEAWELRVDCAMPDGWQSLTFPVDKGALLRCAHDGLTRQRLLEDWREQLRSCETESSRARSGA
jgi:hypothetical protein